MGKPITRSPPAVVATPLFRGSPIFSPLNPRNSVPPLTPTHPSPTTALPPAPSSPANTLARGRISPTPSPPQPHCKIPLGHPTLLPVPRVPFVSQVCQLAITKSPETDLVLPSQRQMPQAASYTKYRIGPVHVTAPSFPPPLTDPSNRVAAADPSPDVTAAANTSNHHHAHSSHVPKPQAARFRLVIKESLGKSVAGCASDTRPRVQQRLGHIRA